METSNSSDNVKVAVRVRQLIQKEVNNGLKSHWTVRNDTITCNEKDTIPPYVFDRVFDETSITMDLFEDICKPIVDAALEGINGTIFAYGQSSSGKTFTMLGSKVQPGIISLSIDEIFNRMNSHPTREFLIRVGYMEIYYERVSDLLSPTDSFLKLQEDTNHNVQVVGIKEEMVNDREKLFAVIEKGNAKRHTAETKQNDRSSRSHCILRIVIESRPIGREDEAVMVSNLYFVDLAGSEKAGDNSGDRFREGCAINKSLFTLGMVIRKLTGDSSQQHVSFRNSSLTRILKNALGGNCKTAIICTMTPAHIEESESTLKFASRAKNICNKPTVNEVMTDEALLKRYLSTINKLKNQIKEINSTDINMEKAELEKRLQEKESAQQKQSEIIANLQTMLVKAGPLIEEPPKKKRRETWCPGKSFRPLNIPSKLAELPQADKLDITDIMPPPNIGTRPPRSIDNLNVPTTLFEEEMPTTMVQADESICGNQGVKELFQLQDQLEDLKEELEKKNNELQELQDFTDLERQMESETIKDLKEKIKVLEESKPWIEEELIKTQQERNKLRQQVEALNMRLEAVEDGSGITAKAQKLTETLTQLDDVNKELDLQKSRSEFHTEQMRMKIEALTLILEEKGVDSESLKHRLGADYIENRDSRQMKTNQADIEDLQIKIDRLIDEKAEKELEVQELQVYKEKFEEQDAIHQKALEDAKEEIDIFRQLYEEEAKKGKVDDPEGTSNIDNVNTEKEIQELKIQLEACQKTVAENDKNFEDLLSKFESEKNEMKNIIRELENQLACKSQTDTSEICDVDRDKEVETLKQELEKREEEALALKRKLESSGTPEKDQSTNQDLLLQYETENLEMKVRIKELEKRLESSIPVNDGVNEGLRKVGNDKFELLTQELEKKEEEITELKLKLDASEKSTIESNTDQKTLLLQHESKSSEMKVSIEELEKRLESSTEVSDCINEELKECGNDKFELLTQELEKKEEEITELKLKLDASEKSTTESNTDQEILLLQHESDSSEMKVSIGELEKRLESSTEISDCINEELKECGNDKFEQSTQELEKKEEEINELKLKSDASKKSTIGNKADQETILLQYESENSKMKVRIRELEKMCESSLSVGAEEIEKIEKEEKTNINELKQECLKKEQVIQELKSLLESRERARSVNASESDLNYELENSFELRKRIEELEKQLESRTETSVGVSDNIEFDGNRENNVHENDIKEREILELKSKLEASQKILHDKNEMKKEELNNLRSKLEAGENTIIASRTDQYLLCQYESDISKLKSKIEELQTKLDSNSITDHVCEKIEMDWDSGLEMFKIRIEQRDEEIKRLKSILEAEGNYSKKLDGPPRKRRKHVTFSLSTEEETREETESVEKPVSENAEHQMPYMILETSEIESETKQTDLQGVLEETQAELQNMREQLQKLSYQIDQLQTSKAQLKAEKQELLMNNEMMQERVDQSEEELKETQEKLMLAEEKMEVLKTVAEEKEEELRMRIEQTEDDLKEAQEKFNMAEERIEELTKFGMEKIEEFKKKIEDGEADFKEAQDKLTTAEERNEELKNLLQEEEEKMKKKLEDGEAELNKALENLTMAEERNEELNNLIKGKEEEMEKYKIQNENLLAEKTELLQAIQDLQERADQKEEGMKETQRKLNLAEERIEEMKNLAEEKLDELKQGELVESQAELVALRGQLQKLFEEKDQLNADKAALKEEKQELVMSNKDINERVSQIEEELKVSNEKFNMAEERIEEFKKLAEEQMEETKKMVDQNEKLTFEKQELLQAIEVLHKRVDQGDEDLKEVQRKLNTSEEKIEELKTMAEERIEAFKRDELGESQAELVALRGQLQQLNYQIDQLNTDKAALSEEKEELLKSNQLMNEKLVQFQTENDSLKDSVTQYEQNLPPDTIKINPETDNEWEKKWIEFTREEKRKRMIYRVQIRELQRNLKRADLRAELAKDKALQELIMNGKEKEIIAELEMNCRTANEDADRLHSDLDDEKKLTAELREKIADLEKKGNGAFISTDDHNCKYKMESIKANMEFKDFKYEMDQKEKDHKESVKYYEDKISELKNEMRRLANGLDNTVCVSNQPTKLEFGASDSSTSSTNTSSSSSVRSGIVDHFKVCITENENKRLKKELEQQKALVGKEVELSKENMTLKKEIKRLKEEQKKVKIASPLKTLNSPAKQRDTLSSSSCRKGSPIKSTQTKAEMTETAATAVPQLLSTDFFSMKKSTHNPLSTRKKPPNDTPDNCKTT